MRGFGYISFLLVFLTVQNTYASVREDVAMADIVRNEYVSDGAIPLYLGNGRFGACFDQTGLQYDESSQKQLSARYGATQFMHICHYGRGRYEMDYLLPVASLYWEDKPVGVHKYCQRQSYYDGTLTTSFADDKGDVKLLQWFDAQERNVFCLKVTSSVAGRKVVIDLPKAVKTHYGSRFSGEVSFRKTDCGWVAETTISGHPAEIRLISDAVAEVSDNKLVLSLGRDSYVVVAYGQCGNADVSKSLSRTKEWWHRKWEEVAFVNVSDVNVQKMFVRSMAQILSTCNDDGLGLMPPCGLSGNAWPFPFPHDLSFILSACLGAGEIDVAKAWVEYIGKDVDALKGYTARLMGTKGIFSPWCYPYGGVQGLNGNGVPNRAFYEIHNSGHLCRMAYETALFVNDSAWTRQYAIPLVRECAAFYRSMLVREADGLWHLFNIPSFGQDENGGSNQKDYLDALYSARYCFETAVKCGLDDDGFYSNVLSEGLAFDTLKSSRGYYFSCNGRGESDFGNQKHPVQLNEITLLPMNGGISREARLAYKDRYEITERAAEPFSRGWTCGSFILASARACDADGWMRDWNSLIPADAVDKDFIQFYESSKLHGKAYFTTNSGLFVGSVLTCAVNDWEGEIKVGACNPWQKLSFRNIYSKLGVRLSGDAYGKVTATAWKDCDVVICGQEFSLGKGQSVVVDASQKKESQASAVIHISGPQTVDLGLSVDWTVCNSGASLPTDTGSKFSYNEGRENCPDGFAVPTAEQWEELIRDCKWTFSELDGAKGFVVKSRKKGYEDRSIFLPAAGCQMGMTTRSEGLDCYYWSGSTVDGRTDYAWMMFATPGHIYKVDGYKFIRQSLRLVRPKTENIKPRHNATDGIYLSCSSNSGLLEVNDTVVFQAWKDDSLKEDLRMSVYVEGRKKMTSDVSLTSIPTEVFRYVSDSTASVIVRIGVKGQNKRFNSVGVVYSPQNYEPGFGEPEDFVSYWDSQKRTLRKSRPEIVRTRIESPKEGYDVWSVEISMPQGRPVRGYMAMPSDVKAGSLPVLLYVHSAGVSRKENRATVDRAVRYAQRGSGAIAFDINAHGFLNDQPQEYYDALDQGELKNYRADMLSSRDNYYFRLMLLRMVRAMDFLCSLPEWDGKRAVVYGESQGGYQAAALSGLDSRVTFAMMNVPAHMDIGSPLQGRKAAWPGIYDKGMKSTPELVNKILPYFDAVNFLRHTKAKIVVEAGLVDETCPPGCVWSGFNVCPSKDKNIFFYPYRPHTPGNMQSDRFSDWKLSVDNPKHELLDNYLK